VFRGTYQHSIDAKGRLSIPARFRDVLNTSTSINSLIITSYYEPCLVAYPLEEYHKFESEINKLSSLNKDVRVLIRKICYGAHECEIDSHGRMLVPPILRNYAHLNKDVLLIGVLNKFEIWDKEVFETYEADSDDLEVLAEKISKEHIKGNSEIFHMFF